MPTFPALLLIFALVTFVGAQVKHFLCNTHRVDVSYIFLKNIYVSRSSWTWRPYARTTSRPQPIARGKIAISTQNKIFILQKSLFDHYCSQHLAYWCCLVEIYFPPFRSCVCTLEALTDILMPHVITNGVRKKHKKTIYFILLLPCGFCPRSRWHRWEI